MKINIGDYPKNPDKERKIEIKISSSDVFSLDDTLAHVIHDCLVKFKQRNLTIGGHPGDLTHERWHEILDEIIEIFLMIKNGEKYEWDNKKDKKMQKGLNLFAKYYFHLWL